LKWKSESGQFEIDGNPTRLLTEIMNRKLFGTDGIRSRAGSFPLNAAAVEAIGRAIGEKLGGTVLVGQDTRISSPWIFELLRSGVAQTPAAIYDAKVVPTPAVALLTKTGEYSGGVMISASHNPFEDNGVKVFSSDGTKLNDEAEAEIEQRIFQLLPASAEQAVDAIPERPFQARHDDEAVRRYQKLLSSQFKPGPWLKGLRIVADCANGAMSRVAPTLLETLGAEVQVLHCSPTGKNINAACGAVHIEALHEAMKRSSADFGVAYDGDGDRSLFVSHTGRRIDGDAVLLLMARRMQRLGRLIPPVVVGTLMTNFALEKLLAAEGIRLERVAVGDRFIFEQMRRGGGILGGEPSGHVIFPDFGLSGDGLFTTLKVAEALVEERASLDDLTKDWIEAPQLLESIRVRQKIPLETIPAVQAKIDDVNARLQGFGRLVIRYSGTEPVLRVMIESDDASRNRSLMEELLDVIGRHIETI